VSSSAADVEATRGPATDGRAAPRVPRTLGIALAAGLIAGAVTQLLQGILPAEMGSFANSATPWLAVAFGVGSTASRWWLAAIAGAVTLMAALVGYYGLVQLRFGYGVELRGTVLLWLIAAVVGGPVFGVAGRWWRSDRPWLRATGPALLGASAIAEGVYLAGIPTVASAGPLFVALGLAIPVVLGRRRDDRIRGLLLLLPCVGLGAAGFVATIALYGVLTGT
jgi:hypothetical protein